MSQFQLRFFNTVDFVGGHKWHPLLSEQAPDVKLLVQRTGLLVYHWGKLFDMGYVFSPNSMSGRFDPFQFKNQPGAYSQHRKFSVNSQKVAKL